VSATLQRVIASSSPTPAAWSSDIVLIQWRTSRRGCPPLTSLGVNSPPLMHAKLHLHAFSSSVCLSPRSRATVWACCRLLIPRVRNSAWFLPARSAGRSSPSFRHRSSPFPIRMINPSRRKRSSKVGSRLHLHPLRQTERDDASRGASQKITDPRVMFFPSRLIRARHRRRGKATPPRSISMRRAGKFVCPPDHETVLKIARAMKVTENGKPAMDEPILHTDRLHSDRHQRVRSAHVSGRWMMRQSPADHGRPSPWRMTPVVSAGSLSGLFRSQLPHVE